MSVDPDSFTTEQWVRYNTYWTNAATLTILGGILIVVGYSWGMQALSPAIQDTPNGLTIIEGGATDGTIKGPFLAAFGVTLLVLVPAQIKRAKSVRRWIE